MPVSASFYRSSRSLNADGVSMPAAGLLLGLLLFGAWIAWASSARVARYEVADTARLEVVSAVYPVQSNIAGRVLTSRLTLGKQVLAGDVLVELDADSERLSLNEEITRFRTLSPQLEALKAQTGAQDQGRREERTVLGVAVDESRAKLRESEALAHQAEVDAERSRQLRAEGLLPEADFQKARAEAQSKRAAAENLTIAVSRLEPELRVRETDRDSRLRQISTDATKIDAQMATSSATIKRLEHEIERRRIRAPIAGRLGECAVLRPGAYLEEGDKLGVIIPAGNLRIVADFLPAAALGRVHPGQPGTLRLQGFPWAQYGTIPARVTRVASEIRDGHVRVELEMEPLAHSAIPVQHGLPGTVEVEVERISPAALVLRTAGQTIAVH